MKIFLCLILIILLSSCAPNNSAEDVPDIAPENFSPEISVSEESESLQEYTKTITAHTNFELENGGFEPKFTVTLTEDIVLDGEGDNLMAVFPDGNSLSLGWCFIYEIKEYDKYDNPLYYYENPGESLGYLSHEPVACGSYDGMRVTCQAYSGKGDTDSVSYRFDYFIIINDSEILSLSFYSSDNLESTLKTQEGFIANIQR